jgi:FkbM family methyltransferase
MQSDIYIINKRNTTFQVTGNHKKWFLNSIHNGNWEEETFNVLDEYQNKEKIYLDIGSWVGPTVLYSADKFKHIYSFEPDPIAVETLEKNISINNFQNITVIKKAISNKNGNCDFGGNGELGNSMSTLLVGLENKEEFFNGYGEENQFLSKEIRKQDVINIESITIEHFLKEYNLDPKNIGLIKIDIEGGEIIVVPSIKTFLEKYKPNLYISLHYVFLKQNQINEILKILFDIYDECHIYDKNDKYQSNIQEIIDKKITQLVFRSKNG